MSLKISLVFSILVFLGILIALKNLTGSNGATDSEIIASGITLLLMIPHLFFYSLGIVFHVIGTGTKIKGFVLTAGIMYILALAFMLVLVAPLSIIIFTTFLGYARMK